MILNRLGNKSKLALDIQKHFPAHDVYIELFFGAGGMFFNKPKVKHNYVNDIDNDVYGLFRQLLDNKDELLKWIEICPVTETQFKEWGKGKREESAVLNAVRFLFLSNFGLYGKVGTLRIGAVNPKKQILEKLESTFLYLKDVYFINSDFRDVFRKVDYKSNMGGVFCYADPPYIGTTDNYSHSFKESDSNDLFNELQSSGVRWAMSEFDHPFILEQAKQRNLTIEYIGERKALTNTRTEVLIMNYKSSQQKLF